MRQETSLNNGNIYQVLGYKDPEEMLARANLMLDIVAAVHHRGLDLEETLALLEVDKERYFEILGGRVQQFTRIELERFLERLSATRPASIETDWWYLSSQWLRNIRDWLIRETVPATAGLTLGYRSMGFHRPRGFSERPATSSELGAVPSSEASLKDLLEDTRFRWLPTLLSQKGDDIELMLQRRDSQQPADPEPPEVVVLIQGQPTEITGREYFPETHALVVRIAGALPGPEYRLSLSPSDQGRVTLNIEAP